MTTDRSKNVLIGLMLLAFSVLAPCTAFADRSGTIADLHSASMNQAAVAYYGALNYSYTAYSYARSAYYNLYSAFYDAPSGTYMETYASNAMTYQYYAQLYWSYRWLYGDAYDWAANYYSYLSQLWTTNAWYAAAFNF